MVRKVPLFIFGSSLILMAICKDSVSTTIGFSTLAIVNAIFLTH